MNDWTNLADAARLGGWVIYPLTVLAIVALAITLDRAYAFWRFARMPGLADLTQLPGSLPKQHAFSRIGQLLRDPRTPLWRIETRVEAAAAQIERDMSRGLWLLETIVTAAPRIARNSPSDIFRTSAPLKNISPVGWLAAG